MSNESQAVAMYAILARDWTDFLEMLSDQTMETLELLRNMLELPNEKHSADTKELNSIGASCVVKHIESRKIKR